MGRVGRLSQPLTAGERKIMIENDGYIPVDETSGKEMVDHTWWDLFPAMTSSNATMKKSSFYNNIVEIGAWRSVEIVDDVPPTLMAFFDRTEELTESSNAQVRELLDLVKRGTLKSMNPLDEARVGEALRIAYIALWGKTTLRSLEVSINRAKGVAAVLGELKADTDVVIAGILHDVLAETKHDLNYNRILSELRARFGTDAVQLCEAYMHLPKFMARKADYTPFQSENQVQMLVAVAEDYRALYIRLADRLHTLRVLKSLPLDSVDRHKIAQEALNVYAPLAHKMGVMKVKGELEDLAFKVLDPDTYQRTKYTQISANKAYHEAAEKVQDLITNDVYIKSNKCTFKLSYRIKDKYQIALKMQRKGLKNLSDVRDVLGLRLIVETPQLKNETVEAYEKRQVDICYYLVDKLRLFPGWEPAEYGFKDYIAGQKQNGYQSLHQYIRNKAFGTNVEVQVRTKSMHMIAELGDAAHWHYKDLIYNEKVASSKLYKNAWRSTEQLRDCKNAAQMLGLAKSQLNKSRVFVFLDDKATVLNLKKGSTCLDAAFAIHTELGLFTAGVTVNNRDARLEQPLSNCDIISVEASKSLVPTAKMSWLSFVKSRMAQQTLRSHFKSNQRSLFVTLGCVQLLMTLTLSSEKISERYNGKLLTAADLASMVIERSGAANIGDFLMMLGEASKDQVTSSLANLLDIPPSDLTVSSIKWGLMWARMQGKNGWQDQVMRSTVLLPLLREILPALGINNAEKRWIALIGERSLTNDFSKYFSSLSKHLVSAKQREAQELSTSFISHTSTLASIETAPLTTQAVSTPSLRALSVEVKVSPIYDIMAAESASQNSDAETEERDEVPLSATIFAPSPRRNRASIHLRARHNNVVLASRPFSLEAPAMSLPMLRLAKKVAGERAKERNQALTESS